MSSRLVTRARVSFRFLINCSLRRRALSVSSLRRALVGLSAALLLLPASARAQGELAPPVPYARMVSLNPLLLVFGGYVSLDLEQRLARGSTAGISVSSLSFRGVDRLALEAKMRYYLAGRAFDGFSVGLVSGVVRLREDSSSTREYAVSLGFIGEQQWLYGVDRRLALTAGGGFTRLFFVEDGDRYGRVAPILRLSIGWGF